MYGSRTVPPKKNPPGGLRHPQRGVGDQAKLMDRPINTKPNLYLDVHGVYGVVLDLGVFERIVIFVLIQRHTRGQELCLARVTDLE